MFRRLFTRFFGNVDPSTASPSRVTCEQGDRVKPIPSDTGISDEKICAEFVSKFESANTAAYFRQYPYWRQALSCDPEETIRQLVSRGLLQKCNVLDSLVCKSAKELREIAKQLRVSSSGTKVELAHRIISTNPSAAEATAQNMELFTCTPEGLKCVRAFYEQQIFAKQQIETATIAALLNQNFELACRTFSNDDTKIAKEHLRTVNAIFNATSRRLVSATEAQLQRVRVAATMMFLSGEKTATRWIPPDVTSAIGMQPEDAAALLLNIAQNKTRMDEIRSLGIAKVQVLGGNDTCEHCVKMSNKTFSIKNTPAVPFPECTCESGCTCMLTAVL